MRSMLFVALLGVASASQADIPAATSASSPAMAAKPDDGDKLVCRRELTVGSNIPGHRVCKTKRDIEAERIAGRDSAKAMTTPSGGSNSSN